MSKTTNSKNSFGFSLIEDLIALGHLGVVTFGLMNVMSQMMAGQRITQARQDLIAVGSEVQTMLQNETVCASGLKGSDWDATKASVQYPPPLNTAFAYNGLPFAYKINADTLSDGTTLTTYNLIANKIQLVNAQAAGTDINGKEVYRAHIIGQFSPKDSSQGGLKDFGVRILGSGYFTVSGGKITSCSANMPVNLNDVTATQTCTSLGGTFDATTKKCLLTPNYDDPTAAAALCKTLGGALTNGKCNLGGSGTPGPSGGARWVDMGPVAAGSAASFCGLMNNNPNPCSGALGSLCPTVGARCCGNPIYSSVMGPTVSGHQWVCQ